MRVPTYLIGLLLAGGFGSGCAANAEPLVPSGLPGLNAPEPPGRVVVPAPEQPTLPPVVGERETGTAATTSKPPVRNPVPRPTTPPPVDPPATEPPPATSPPATLLTSANTAEFEKRVREQLKRAQTNLQQLNPKNLGADARAQYDSAQGFVRQAEEALKVKNLVYAGHMADKAATMAALLRR